MEQIIISLMSGPKDGDMLLFETLLAGREPTEITIGRREGCDVCLNYDSQVSREHALLTYDGVRFWLEDTASTNGTFVDDDKLSGRREVLPGQLFRVGRTWLRVEPIAQFETAGGDDLPF